MNIRNSFNKFKYLMLAVKLLGIKWFVYRLFYAFSNKFGFITLKSPQLTWDDINTPNEIGNCLDFIGNNIELLESDSIKSVQIANDICNGYFSLFYFHRKHMGFPPNWHKNPVTNKNISNKIHWSKIKDFDNGDIKCIWDISRFSWIYPLIKSYIITSDEKYAETFWKLFENWLVENQPNSGVNWKCGQEATFRLIATCFAQKIFADSPSTTLTRKEKWLKFVAFTGKRIKANIEYALSQNNNHGISECIGYLTVCQILGTNKDKCKEKVEKLLLKQLTNLVYEDGAFSQNSTIYHRVVVDDLSWIIALYKNNNDIFCEKLKPFAEKLLNFLIYITNLDSGLAPIHGANDGSRILPFTDNDYLDMRPSIDLLSSLLYGHTPINDEQTHEILWWFGLKAKYKKTNFKINNMYSSGWYIVQNNFFKAFSFSPKKFKHRPTQGTLLQTDIWYKGIPIAIDPGTYSYNSEETISKILNSTFSHNTIIIDKQEQMQRLSRFLCLPWPNSETIFENNSFSIKTNVYKKHGVLVTRNLDYSNNKVKITDVLESVDGKIHLGQLHWLIEDYKYEQENFDGFTILRFFTSEGKVSMKLNVLPEDLTIMVGNKGSGIGWSSPYYYYYKPAISITATKKFYKKLTFETIFFSNQIS